MLTVSSVALFDDKMLRSQIEKAENVRLPKVHINLSNDIMLRCNWWRTLRK